MTHSDALDMRRLLAGLDPQQQALVCLELEFSDDRLDARNLGRALGISARQADCLRSSAWDALRNALSTSPAMHELIQLHADELVRRLSALARDQGLLIPLTLAQIQRFEESEGSFVPLPRDETEAHIAAIFQRVDLEQARAPKMQSDFDTTAFMRDAEELARTVLAEFRDMWSYCMSDEAYPKGLTQRIKRALRDAASRVGLNCWAAPDMEGEYLWDVVWTEAARGDHVTHTGARLIAESELSSDPEEVAYDFMKLCDGRGVLRVHVCHLWSDRWTETRVLPELLELSARNSWSHEARDQFLCIALPHVLDGRDPKAFTWRAGDKTYVERPLGTW